MVVLGRSVWITKAAMVSQCVFVDDYDGDHDYNTGDISTQTLITKAAMVSRAVFARKPPSTSNSIPRLQLLCARSILIIIITMIKMMIIFVIVMKINPCISIVNENWNSFRLKIYGLINKVNKALRQKALQFSDILRLFTAI